MHARRHAVGMILGGMLACLAPALAACGGSEPEVPWYQQAAQQRAGLDYDGYVDPDGYYYFDPDGYYPPYDPDGYYPPYDPDGYYNPYDPDGYTYPTIMTDVYMGGCYGGICGPCVTPTCLAGPTGMWFDGVSYSGVPYPAYPDGYDGGPMGPGTCAGPLCTAPNTKALLVELTGTLSATVECALAKPGFNGLHGTSWCRATPDTPRGELAQMCARCCPEACLVLGTLLRSGSDGGLQDPAAAQLVFERGCTLNGGAINCMQAQAVIIDTTLSKPVATVPGTIAPAVPSPMSEVYPP